MRVSPSDVEWDYAGLNHRGFIFMLRHRGEDLMPRLPEMLDGRTIFGIKAEDIREIGALPLKYFRLSPSVGRAKFLGELRKALAGELEAGTTPRTGSTKSFAIVSEPLPAMGSSTPSQLATKRWSGA